MISYDDYFEPVSLEKPLIEIIPSGYTFAANAYIHTSSQKIKKLDDYRVAVIGVPEARNAPAPSMEKAPDKIREVLYQMARIPGKIKITDLGNLKKGNSVNDTYTALMDIATDLLSRNLAIVLLGGSHDLAIAIYRAFKKLNRPCALVDIDSHPDLLPSSGKQICSLGYLRTLIRERAKVLQQYTCIGYQQYLTDKSALDILEHLRFEAIRLGQLRQDITRSEPYLRDADMVNIDLGAVRFSDAPGTLLPNTNGLYGEELCQLAKYAGFGGKTSALGVFEILPDRDPHGITSQLAAQAVWYFLEGLARNKYENPLQSNGKFKKFVVTLDDFPAGLVFYQSYTTERWWIEVPSSGTTPSVNVFACTREDYDSACNRQITDRIWKIFKNML